MATVPALPGCVTQGDTLEEAREHAKEAILCHLEALQQEGDPIRSKKRAWSSQ
ncbi:MAG: type II toxin-antitoxin system HicB family antitoxin [Myxococcota bacterium]